MHDLFGFDLSVSRKLGQGSFDLGFFKVIRVEIHGFWIGYDKDHEDLHRSGLVG